MRREGDPLSFTSAGACDKQCYVRSMCNTKRYLIAVLHSRAIIRRYKGLHYLLAFDHQNLSSEVGYRLSLWFQIRVN